MKFKLATIITLAIGSLLFTACGDDEPATQNLNLSITGLEDLGPTAIYEGWIMVDGAPQTTGTFSVDAAGNLSQTSFALNSEDLEKATAFILTVEPTPDPSPAPSDVHILAGD